MDLWWDGGGGLEVAEGPEPLFTGVDNFRAGFGGAVAGLEVAVVLSDGEREGFVLVDGPRYFYHSAPNTKLRIDLHTHFEVSQHLCRRI